MTELAQTDRVCTVKRDHCECWREAPDVWQRLNVLQRCWVDVKMLIWIVFGCREILYLSMSSLDATQQTHRWVECTSTCFWKRSSNLSCLGDTDRDDLHSSVLRRYESLLLSMFLQATGQVPICSEWSTGRMTPCPKYVDLLYNWFRTPFHGVSPVVWRSLVPVILPLISTDCKPC